MTGVSAWSRNDPTRAGYRHGPCLVTALPIPERAALFLDFDGTLVELAETPSAVVVPDWLNGLLNRLNAICGGAVAFVTGRSISDLDALLGHEPENAVGVHGAEWRLGGAEVVVGDGHPFEAERRTIRAFADDHAGIIIEEKSAGLTLHYRREPALQDAAHSVMDLAFADRDDFETMSGHMMVEARRIGVHKGAGIERLMQNAPFAGRTPVFLGDDVTDEDGFAAGNAFGGISIKVGEGATCATHRLTNIPAVYDYLEAFASTR